MADQGSQEELSSIDSIFDTTVNGSNVRWSNDLIVLALHASLLSERFECISVNQENLSHDQTNDVTIATPTSPALPEGWNSSPDVYVLQYKTCPPGLISKCLIKILPLGDQLLINALSTDDMKNVITVTLPTTTYIRERGGEEGGSYTTSSLKNIIQLFSFLNKEMTQKLKRSSTVSEKREDKKKEKEESSFNALLDSARDRASLREDIGSSSEEDNNDDTPEVDRRSVPYPYFEIGAGDLSPFGGPGGGMLMDPLRDGRIGHTPPGFHPPGARYDPLSPFEPPRFHPGRGQYGGRGRGRGGGGRGGHMFGPDPDHLPPPGYDDMFM